MRAYERIEISTTVHLASRDVSLATVWRDKNGWKNTSEDDSRKWIKNRPSDSASQKESVYRTSVMSVIRSPPRWWPLHRLHDRACSSSRPSRLWNLGCRLDPFQRCIRLASHENYRAVSGHKLNPMSQPQFQGRTGSDEFDQPVV